MALAERRDSPVETIGADIVEGNQDAMEENQAEMEEVVVKEMETADEKAPVESHRPSLREQPSFLTEVSIAKSRRAALQDLQQRLSSSRELLRVAREDLSTRPWLRSTEIPALLRSISTTSESAKGGEKEGADERSRNLSSDTNNTENSEDLDIHVEE